jgi:hypothetical protein
MRKMYKTSKGIGSRAATCTVPRGTQFLWQAGFLILALLVATLLSACGGSGGGSGSSGGGDDNAVVASLSNYVMPSELSAVPTSEESSTASSLRILARTFSRAYSDAGTDYTKAITRKFVEEHTLEQFDVLEDVLTAINQTKYYEQLGEPAYQAMVIQVGEGEGGKEQKSLQPWVVEADIVDTDGNVVDPAATVEGAEYNVRVRAWIEEEPGELIKAEFIIEERPTQNADGSYVDYGVWALNVKFEDTEDPDAEVTDYFAASCEVGENGESIIKLHERFSDEGPSEDMSAEVKAAMYRGETTGFGKVHHPDWEALWGPDAGDLTEIPVIRAKYAYNEDYLGVQRLGHDAIYKDRNNLVEMTHQYGVFNADTGRDLMRDKQFGFPIYYQDETTNRRVHGYYGAWQGRHQLWIGMGDSEGDQPDLEGTTVTKENHRPDAEEETYTVGKTFDGTLVKRTYVDASLNDIRNIPVEINVGQDYQLLYDSGTWYHCTNMYWDMEGPQCAANDMVDFDDEFGFETLVVGEGDTRKWVSIGGWDDTAPAGQQDKQYAYLPTGNSHGVAAGFYEASEVCDSDGCRMEVGDTPTAIDTTKVNQLWVWVSGSLYVEYTGETEGPTTTTGWVAKELVSFDQERWEPTFGDNDVEYKLPQGREIYINMNGASYIARNDGGDLTVQLELQTAANPENAATVVPDGTVFSEPWDENGATYEFVTDPTSTKYLMLVYADVPQGTQDMDGNTITSGEVVTTGKWGLRATIGDESVDFNWEYNEWGWGSVTYLMDGTDYVILDDPVRFDPITITHNGAEKTLALQFDGWMMGLPDMYNDLNQNNWVMSDEIAEKIVNLEAGTEVTDSVTSTEYVIKPLDVSQFLLPVEEGTDESLLPDLSQADIVDMDDIPVYVEHGMGDMPTGTTVLYSEGIAVEAE